MSVRFDERVAVVTGAASGIGAATANALARAGARLVLADLDSCDELAESISKEGGDVLALKTDVTQAADVQELVRQTLQAYGRLDCAFNNAGVEGKAELATHEADEQAWDRALEVNLKGVFLCMKYQVPAMLDSGGGAIVNGASVASHVAFDKNGAYVASKHAILGLTKTAALEYAQEGVRVNAVCPGVVRTPFIDRFTQRDPAAEKRYTEKVPMDRMADPDEIARSVLWLLSDESSYVTGHGLVVDGGLVAQ